jgi:hypothetical protein
MNDDYRVTIPVTGKGVVAELLEGFRAGEVEHEAAKALSGRVVISHDDDHVFLYAGNDADARTAEATVRPLLPRFALQGGPARFERWHPDEEQWEDMEAALPSTPEEEAVERTRRRELERSESAEAGYPEWEVRVELPNARAAKAFAAQLEREDLRVSRRSHYVLAGAPSEDDARALAERLGAEAPPGARLEVQGTGQEWWSAMHPFAVFGGLGG